MSAAESAAESVLGVAGLQAADPAKFYADVRAFCIVTACRVIGDETTFTKFMTRQCVMGNSATQALQEGVRAVERIHAQLEDAQRLLRVLGTPRVASVMQEVRTAAFEFGRCDVFGVCALSGRVGSSFVIVRGGNAHLLVDARYAPFLYSLWMLWHVSEIETARVETFMRDRTSSGSIRSHIQSFIDTAVVGDDEAGLYLGAYEFVRATLLPLMQEACRGKKSM